MKHNRVSTERASLGKRGLAALALFCVVPIVAALVFLGWNDGAKTSHERIGKGRESRLPGGAQGGGGLPGSEAWSDLAEPRETSRAPWTVPHAASSSVAASDDRNSLPPPNTYADQDAARLARFDENVQAFGERLSAFDRERGSVDEESSEKVKAALQSSLESMHPEIRVTALCTLSVCVVELTSPDPVGTMIARISPWLRKHTRAATGDPVDASDENSLRLAFDKMDALSNF